MRPTKSKFNKLSLYPAMRWNLEVETYIMRVRWGDRGLLRWFSGKESACHCRRLQRHEFWSLGQENPLEKEMATHSSILAWKIPWTEEPGGLQSIGSHRVGHDCSDLAQHCPAEPWLNNFFPVETSLNICSGKRLVSTCCQQMALYISKHLAWGRIVGWGV